jgi:hypothetical protein
MTDQAALRKEIEEMVQSMEDVLESLRTHRGSFYAYLVHCLFNSMTSDLALTGQAAELGEGKPQKVGQLTSELAKLMIYADQPVSFIADAMADAFKLFQRNMQFNERHRNGPSSTS